MLDIKKSIKKCWQGGDNIKRLIKEYNRVEILFTEVGPRARKRRFLRFDEFYQICMWKSARQKNKYLKNKDKVETISRKVFSTHDEKEKIELLCSLEGVGIPTASAILTVLYPENYPIIDIRCIEALNYLGYKELKKTMSFKNWEKYLGIMRTLAKESNVTPRKLDMALFALHSKALGKGKLNLYEKRP